MARAKDIETRTGTELRKAQKLSKNAKGAFVDSFANFAAGLGLQANNVTAASSYAFSFITKNRILLEAMYRGSWIIGAAVDVPADDMTQRGIDIKSTQDPDVIEKLGEAAEDLQIWKALNNTIKWSRLYGTAMGLILIDGQDMRTPLKIDTVGKGQFKGILPMDRWQFVPVLSDLIGSRKNELSPHMGMPRFYDAVPDATLPNLGRIHHSRLIRLDAIEQPHYQKMQDSLWAESVIERIEDRLVAFDSTTTGAAQLVYKAYLRTWKIENLREIIAAGGTLSKALQKNLEFIRLTQSNEGITMIDAKDEFETQTYTFAGLDDVLLQFAQQLAGALDIPLVRLFGQSPAGLNSTGESDLRTYYDGIHKKQETQLRHPVKKILELLSRSMFGRPLPDGFRFDFRPLWQITPTERSTIAQQTTSAIGEGYDKGIVPRDTALRELRKQSPESGLWSSITDEDIKDAESEVPLSEFQPDPMEDDEGEGNGDGDKSKETGQNGKED